MGLFFVQKGKKNAGRGMQKYCLRKILCSYLQPVQQGTGFESPAQVAELVDALVSNTNEVTLVPVRLRLWVHFKGSFLERRSLFRFIMPEEKFIPMQRSGIGNSGPGYIFKSPFNFLKGLF